jgi:hypothetical protein
MDVHVRQSRNYEFPRAVDRVRGDKAGCRGRLDGDDRVPLNVDGLARQDTAGFRINNR